MKKKGLIILISILTVTGLTAFSCINKNENSTEHITENKTNPINTKLFDLGISDGIEIDYRTGKVTQMTSVKPELSYMVVRKSFGSNSILRTGRAITEEKLKTVNKIDDIIDNYPSNWISDYNSVTISASINGEIIEITGPDDNLTIEQKNLFKNASSFLLVVQYQRENDNGEIQNRQMNVPLVVTPEVEAEYVGGYEKMIKYLKKNSLSQINNKGFTHLPQPSISFVVSKDGIIENVKLKDTSRDKEIDQLLIEVVKTMPKWSPAKNKNGLAIEQEFTLNIGQDGC